MVSIEQSVPRKTAQPPRGCIQRLPPSSPAKSQGELPSPTLASTSAGQGLGRGRARPWGTALCTVTSRGPAGKAGSPLKTDGCEPRRPRAGTDGTKSQERGGVGDRRPLSAPAPSLRRGDHRVGVEDAAQTRRQAAGRLSGGKATGLLSSPPDPGTPPASLAARGHRSGRNDDSLAPRSGRGQMRAQTRGAGDRLRTGPLRRPPARRAGPGADGARRAQDAPDPAVTRGSTRPPRPGCCQTPPPGAGPNKSQPRASGRGARTPGARTCGATKPRKAPAPPSPGAPRSLQSGGSGGGLAPELPGPRRCERSRTKPTRSCGRGDGTRSRPSAPARPLLRSPPAGTGPGPPNPRRPVPGKPNVRLGSPSRPNFTWRDREVGLPATRGAWARRRKLVRAGRRRWAPARAAGDAVLPGALTPRPPGSGLRRSRERATRLALPAGELSAQPRAGARCPHTSARAPRCSRCPPGSTESRTGRAASYSRSYAAPATRPGAVAGEAGAQMPSVGRKLSLPAAPRPCARASGAPTAARVSRRPGEAGPAPRRRAPAAPALAAPPPRVVPQSPGSRTPRRPPPLPLAASTPPTPAGMVAAASGLWPPAPWGGWGTPSPEWPRALPSNVIPRACEVLGRVVRDCAGGEGG